MYIIQTNRLYMRDLCSGDFSELCGILQDSEVMYAWEHAFTDEEVTEWIDKNIVRYERDGYGYFAVILKETGELIGTAGLLVETIDKQNHTGLGYILGKKFWHEGYCTEAANACIKYAFEVLGKSEVIADIRTENKSSIAVAERLGMELTGSHVKNYKGKDMTHLIFTLKNKL